eukprot:Filipodium_phascolosomae@DN2260_c0_g1_i3.p1
MGSGDFESDEAEIEKFLQAVTLQSPDDPNANQILAYSTLDTIHPGQLETKLSTDHFSVSFEAGEKLTVSTACTLTHGDTLSPLHLPKDILSPLHLPKSLMLMMNKALEPLVSAESSKTLITKSHHVLIKSDNDNLASPVITAPASAIVSPLSNVTAGHEQEESGVVEGGGDDCVLSECRFCKRKFLASRIEYHQRICEAISNKHRTTFSAQQQRLKDADLQTQLVMKDWKTCAFCLVMFDNVTFEAHQRTCRLAPAKSDSIDRNLKSDPFDNITHSGLSKSSQLKTPKNAHKCPAHARFMEAQQAAKEALHECKHCHRKFGHHIHEAHEAICEKVFGTHNKPVDFKRKRAQDTSLELTKSPSLKLDKEIITRKNQSKARPKAQKRRSVPTVSKIRSSGPPARRVGSNHSSSNGAPSPGKSSPIRAENFETNWRGRNISVNRSARRAQLINGPSEILHAKAQWQRVIDDESNRSALPEEKKQTSSKEKCRTGEDVGQNPDFGKANGEIACADWSSSDGIDCSYGPVDTSHNLSVQCPKNICSIVNDGRCETSDSGGSATDGIGLPPSLQRNAARVSRWSSDLKLEQTRDKLDDLHRRLDRLLSTSTLGDKDS